MSREADNLIYASVSAMHAIAATLTGEAKQDLSALRNLLESTTALPRTKADELAMGVARVREHLVLGPTPDPVGDGNCLWDVFMAAWSLRQETIEPDDTLPLVLDSLAYTLEAHAQSCHGEAKDELHCLLNLLGGGRKQLTDEWRRVHEEVSRAQSQYQSLEGRRAAVQSLCGLSRRLWRQYLGRR